MVSDKDAGKDKDMNDQDISREGLNDAREAIELERPRTFTGTWDETIERLGELGVGGPSARGVLALADQGQTVDIGSGQAVRKAVRAGRYAILNGARTPQARKIRERAAQEAETSKTISGLSRKYDEADCCESCS